MWTWSLLVKFESRCFESVSKLRLLASRSTELDSRVFGQTSVLTASLLVADVKSCGPATFDFFSLLYIVLLADMTRHLIIIVFHNDI